MMTTTLLEVASCPFVHFLCCVKIPPCVCVPVAAATAIAAAATDSAAGLRRGRWPYSARCHGHQCRVTAIALELRPLTPQGTIATTVVVLFDENFHIQLFTNSLYFWGFYHIVYII